VQYENNRTLGSAYSSEGKVHGDAILNMKEEVKKYQLYKNDKVVKEFAEEEV
jgi:hypothetical protein